MSPLEIGLGSASLAIGAVTALQPGVVGWLPGKLKKDRSTEETGEPAGKTSEFVVRILQVLVPLILGVVGVVIIIHGS